MTTSRLWQTRYPLLKDDPVFLLCSERAGSNLIRCLMNAHQNIFAPNTMALGLLCADYDDRAQKSDMTWASLLCEFCRRVNASTYYTGVTVSEDELRYTVPQHDVATLYLYPYYKGMIGHGRERLFIKEHHTWRLVPFLRNHFANWRIVVQVRDPRDHAASCKRLSRWYSAYHGSVARASSRWVKDQQEALRLVREHGLRRIHLHRYEDLVNRPHETLGRVCAFIGVEWSDRTMTFHETEAEIKRRSDGYLTNMWAGLDQPLTTASVGRWKTALTTSEVLTVEEGTESLMSPFGYARSLPNPPLALRTTALVARIVTSIRFSVSTLVIWLLWVLSTGNFRLPLETVIGESVRAHLPYEYFRDRYAYKLR